MMNCELRQLNTFIKSCSTSNAAIKNTASPIPKEGWYPAYSASGQDVWLPEYRYSGKGIVVSAVGARCGKCFQADGKWNVTANTHVLLVDESIADYKYCWYLLNNENWWIKSGSGQPFVKVKDSLNRSILLPDLSTQQHIAAILDKISEGTAVCGKMMDELDLMVKAKFVEMFGDPVSNEREWNVETLNDVCTEIGDGLHGTPEYDDNGEYPFINGNNLINGAIEITPATKKVNAEIYKKHYIDISANALLLSVNGTLGKLAFYNGEKVMLGKSACYCNFKPEINRAFVYGVMKTEAFAGFLEKSATASTIKNVGLKAIRGYKLIMPPQALQMQFIEFSNQVDKSKLAVKQSLEKLETLKKSLMQEYLG